MPYKLEFDGNKSVDIAGYLLVYPFDFEPAEGKLQIAPNGAVAFVNIVTVQMQSSTFPAASSELPAMCDFAVTNTVGKQILKMCKFGVQTVGTPASLDMNRAVWVLTGGRNTPDVAISFEPAPSSFPTFAGAERNTFLWGAEIRDGREVLLQASLSVPVYDRDIETNDTWVRDYFAFGPANSKGQDKSLFAWVAGHGRTPTIDDNNQVQVPVGDNLANIDVADIRRTVTNRFFGPSEQQQVATARGALFIMNGAIVHTAWRPLWRFIKDVVSGGDPWEHAQKLPISQLDQTVAQTAKTVEKRQQAFQIDTFDFEGIALWNLARRGDGEPAPPMHY